MVYILMTIFLISLLNLVVVLEQYFDPIVNLYCLLTIIIALLALSFLFYKTRRIKQLNLFPNILRREDLTLNESAQLSCKYIITFIFFLCLCLACEERLSIIYNTPIVPYTADMLPVINAAIQRFLAGENPYRTYLMPWPVHLAYLPLLWLSYIPFHIFSLDLRDNGLLSIYIIYFIFYLIAMKELNQGNKVANIFNALLILLLGSYFLFTRRIIWFTPMAHTPIYWAAIALFIYGFVYSKNIYVHAFCYSLCIGIRPTAFFLFPFLLLYYFRNYTIKIAFKFLILSLIFFGIIVFPFFVSTPTEFYNATVKSYLNLGNYVWGFNRDWVLNTFGFTGILYYLGIDRLVLVLLIITQLMLIIVANFRIKDKTDCLIFMALGMLFSSFFMSVPWIYLYFTSFLIFSFAAVFILLSNSQNNSTEFIKSTKSVDRQITKWYIPTFILGLVILVGMIIIYPETNQLEFTDPAAKSHMHKGWGPVELIRVPKGNTIPAVTMVEDKSDISLPLSILKNRKMKLQVIAPEKRVGLEILVNNNLSSHIQIKNSPYLQEIQIEIPRKYFILGNNVISFKPDPDLIKYIHFYSITIL